MLVIYKCHVATGKMVIDVLIPSHNGIHGNTVVDQETKEALDDLISNCSKTITDVSPFILKWILKSRQNSWNQQISTRLDEIHSSFSTSGQNTTGTSGHDQMSHWS